VRQHNYSLIRAFKSQSVTSTAISKCAVPEPLDAQDIVLELAEAQR
jgi:hypothetical protein